MGTAPRMAGPLGRFPLVGRQVELESLLSQLADAGRGAGGLALVEGEPGIGKSRLLAEVAELARRDGWAVLAGQAYDTDGNVQAAPTDPLIANKKTYWESSGQITRRVRTGGAAAGSDREWEAAFERAQGRTPTAQDRADRAWSLEFLRANGRAPTQADWDARYRETHPA
jgi:predicted ATPase